MELVYLKFELTIATRTQKLGRFSSQDIFSFMRILQIHYYLHQRSDASKTNTDLRLFYFYLPWFLRPFPSQVSTSFKYSRTITATYYSSRKNSTKIFCKTNIDNIMKLSAKQRLLLRCSEQKRSHG